MLRRLKQAMGTKNLVMGIIVGMASILFFVIFIVGVIYFKSANNSLLDILKGGSVFLILGIIGIMFSIYEIKKYIKEKSDS